MSKKHKKSASLSSPKKEATINQRILKKSLIEIMRVDGLIGTQSVKWSFSKANRFMDKKPDPSAEFIELKSTIGKGRSAGFGFGKRWAPSNPKGKDAPPSTTYTLPGSMDRKFVGGKISPSKSKSDNRRWSTPGPGTYNIKSCIGNGVSCTLKSRHAKQSKNCSPPPGTYNPNHSLVESGRYISISFGTKTYTDSQARFSTPGPGTYDLSSAFTSLSPSPSPKRQRLARKNSL
ncbi:hypothetical protein SteCoe_22629 [Stentor coeruleus]|uniref:Uncharacterized protein n=1 Tax=Stentor coeruleus TaxID=5963 RepID=A0A1R2BME3_9CILI|nr:hypothetical protein SteCoe_22629 [Stentor coeruleus]